MFQRRMLSELRMGLDRQAAVALLGPRQAGKTTLALALAGERSAIYLDLERPGDLAKLEYPEEFLRLYEGQLVILDEIQRVPGLFPVLRGLIDAGRRRGHGTGRFLVLGSASMELLRQSGESLAGRIRYLELAPLDVLEVGTDGWEKLWLRGGFPESFLAADEAASMEWRNDLIRTYLERDIPQLGPRIPADTLRRFWTMLAHTQGVMHNASRIAASLELSAQTIGRYTDLMVDLLLVRRLQPYLVNVGKRVVKSPKIYLRDSGLQHALLNLPDRDALLGHPAVGGSWEGFVIENLLRAAPAATVAGFYRCSGGAEVDLVLELPGGERWAVEIKRGATARPGRGFHSACDDLQPSRRWLVHSGADRFPLGGGVEAIGLHELTAQLAARRHRGETRSRVDQAECPNDLHDH